MLWGKNAIFAENKLQMKTRLFPIIKNTTRLGRLFTFLVLLLVGLLLGTFLSATLMLMFNNQSANALRLAQGISQITMFILPPLLYSLLIHEKPFFELGIRRINNIYIAIAGLALIFVCLPVNNLLTDINESMRLPERLSAIENIMKASEDKATELTEKMLEMNGWRDLIFDLIIIALIPAIGEELTFRGILQTSLCKVFKNNTWGVIVGAIIFSAIHLQFYGFIPRFVLGLFLGFLFLWSKSLWLSSAMHFLNNGSIVVLYYLNQHYNLNFDVEHFGSSDNVWIIIASALFSIGLLAVAYSNRHIEKHDNRGHEEK